MAKLPPLARTVAVGSTYYRKGDTPPLDHARKITNPKNWEGGQVPDFDGAQDGDDTSTGMRNADAKAQMSGLPGFGQDSQALITRTGGEGAATGGRAVDAEAEGDPTGGQGEDPATSAGNDPNSGGTSTTRPRKTTKATAQQ